MIQNVSFIRFIIHTHFTHLFGVLSKKKSFQKERERAEVVARRRFGEWRVALAPVGCEGFKEI